MERDIRIDILKGIGIILVVWGHATAILIKEICIFHMPLFFFLAGMFYHPKQGFIQSRAKRLLIPFGEYSLIFAVFYFSMGLQGIPLDKLSIHHIAAFDGPLWFLVALFYICVIYYFLDKTVKEKKRYSYRFFCNGAGCRIFQDQFAVLYRAGAVLFAILCCRQMDERQRADTSRGGN